MTDSSEAVDAELFGNQNETYKVLIDWEEAHKKWFLLGKGLLMCLTIVGIATAIFIMHVIRKFPKLGTRINYYIFHMLLCQTVFYIVQHFFVSFYCIVGNTNYLPVDLVEVIWNLEEGTMILVLFYCIVFVFDWYATVYNMKTLLIYQQEFYKFIIWLVYLLIVLKTCLYFAIEVGFMDIVLTLYGIVFVIVTFWNCWRRCVDFNRDEEPLYSRQVVNAVIYSWLPVMTYLLFDCIFERQIFWFKFFMATVFIPQCLISSIPIMIFFILRRKDNCFRAAFAVTLQKKGYEYENSQLQIDQEENTSHNTKC